MSNTSHPNYNVVLDRKKYKGDSFPYLLVMLGLVMNVLYFVCVYKINNGVFYQPIIGVSVIYNLLFMLSVFLCAENLKNYKWKFSVVIIVIGVLQLVRLFIIPPIALEMIEGMIAEMTAAGQTEEQIAAATASYVGAHLRMIIYLICSCALLVSGAVISIVNSLRLQKYKELTEQA